MGKVIGRSALRIFGYMVVFGFIGFMFVPALLGSGAGLRIPLIGLLIVMAGYLMFMDGAYQGSRDCAFGDTLERLGKKGEYTPTPEENAKRFKRGKGVLTALLGAALPLICAIIVAITAKPYVYSLQEYPAWLTPYTYRPEIGEAVAYMEGATPTATVWDYMRVVVRFFLFPYVGLLGTMSDSASLLFDRLSPLIMLILPGLSAIGYQFGPNRRAKEAKIIETAKNTPRKRLKKNRGKNGPQEKKQLI